MTDAPRTLSFAEARAALEAQVAALEKLSRAAREAALAEIARTNPTLAALARARLSGCRKPGGRACARPAGRAARR